MNKPELENEERKQEIAFVMDMINKLCEEAEIGLVPYTTTKGVTIVAIQDARNGKMYCLIKPKEK